MGPGRFLIFYLLTGLIASAVHVVTAPGSPVPTVGASGAISGIMGAYLVLYPRAHVNILVILVIFIRVISIPAWLALLLWFGWQVIAGLPQLSPMRPDISGGVAVWAHIGGFVAGVLLVKLFENPVLVEKRRLIHDARAAHHYA
jgi:membrane associated rhomboid family serine protease